MTRVCDIEKMLYDWAPRDLALEWDNVGLLVGDSGAEVRKVLVSLDVTEAVAAEAVAIGADLVVAHHPLMNCAWHKVQHVTTDDAQGRTITTLLKNNVSAICMHTNLDAADGGVNEVLTGIFGMQDPEAFAEGCGRIGTTMPTTVEALAKFCADTLHTGVKYVNGGRAVTCLAEVSGGGGSYLQEAIDRGADCLVTGEAAHHIALLAKQKGIGLVVAGHWGTEHAIADVLAALIARQFPGLTVAHAEADTDPYCYLA